MQQLSLPCGNRSICLCSRYRPYETNQFKFERLTPWLRRRVTLPETREAKPGESNTRSLLIFLPPPRRRRFPRDLCALLRPQCCRPRLASDLAAFLGDRGLSRRREFPGTGLATLRGDGLHVVLKGDRIRYSFLSSHDSIAYHSIEKNVEPGLFMLDL